jgi:hypothetical protein
MRARSKCCAPQAINARQEQSTNLGLQLKTVSMEAIQGEPGKHRDHSSDLGVSRSGNKSYEKAVETLQTSAYQTGNSSSRPRHYGFGDFRDLMAFGTRDEGERWR